MEVADQWRREWAGTAEYGKVTEGGVTRRVARAMEVLHASGPGARVRVMRAAYHSSAGPGAPAESFMLHSSRRVISSGFNFPLLESPSLPSKPLEISSTPFELNHDSNGDAENYKVTEPDDLEISEPSKWRGSTKGSSIRMPSEESSSTDNASIIDLDAKSRNLHRKYSYDSESSDIQFRSRSSSRTSQILDPPTSLSTLKYKSLLNNSNDWNARRKSYSFEDTSPLNETILHKNDTLAMESSTDSGICKSTELVNDQIDDNSHIKYFGKEERRTPNKEESFKDWLSKNRQTSQYRGTKFKSYREHEIVMEEPKENNIALQSSGKVSITLPVTVETDSDVFKKTQITEDAERKVKKVEFCKTEVHFAAESGKVNIIATDEKPPPSNDFRKRRSAFVPMQEMIDRPITLFGEKNEFPTNNGIGHSLTHTNGDYSESDENTAATKSILKNKIPKPKPYLLGENMDFGNSNGVSNINTSNSVLTAVSLVNQQLEAEKRYKGEVQSIFSSEQEINTNNNNVFRTINAGPNLNTNLNQDRSVITNIKVERAKEQTTTENIKSRLSSLKVSPVEVKPKTRQLRDSDLTYFGVDSERKSNIKDTFKTIEHKFSHNNVIDDIFHSVKMVQKVSNSLSNSVCNSEAESEEAPEYMNIPMNINFAPIPTPRSRSKYDIEPNEINQVRAALRPIVENEIDETKDSLKSSTRRSRNRKQDEVKSSRSISEPPKHFSRSSVENSHRRADNALRTSKHQSVKENIKKDVKVTSINDKQLLEEDIPIYANLHLDTDKSRLDIEKPGRTSTVQREKDMVKTDISGSGRNRDISDRSHSHRVKEYRPDSRTDNSLTQKHSVNKDTLSSSLKKETRSEKVKKSYYSNDTHRKLNDEQTQNAQISRDSDHHNKKEKKEHISRSIQRSSPKMNTEVFGDASRDHSLKNRDTSSHRKRNLSKDKTNSVNDNMKLSTAASSDSSPRRPSAQTKSYQKEKELGSKHSSHRANKHREYVINYDDKNGTVSSICKVKPAFGKEAPKRKRTSKEIHKENHKDSALKTKIVDKMALRK